MAEDDLCKRATVSILAMRLLEELYKTDEDLRDNAVARLDVGTVDIELEGVEGNGL